MREIEIGRKDGTILRHRRFALDWMTSFLDARDEYVFVLKHRGGIKVDRVLVYSQAERSRTINETGNVALFI